MMTAATMTSTYNRVDQIGVHLGLGGLITGYRFTKRLDAKVAQLNWQGRRVVALHKNQWGLLRWAGAQVLMTVTLTFVTLLPSVLVVSEPISAVSGTDRVPRP
jgi:hypothetical protein